MEEGEARNKSRLLQKLWENNWKAKEIKKREGRVKRSRGDPITTNKNSPYKSNWNTCCCRHNTLEKHSLFPSHTDVHLVHQSMSLIVEIRDFINIKDFYPLTYVFISNVPNDGYVWDSPIILDFLKLVFRITI